MNIDPTSEVFGTRCLHGAYSLAAGRGPAPYTARSHTCQEPDMTLCPIAIVAGCKKCPAYSVCPLKSVIGDAPAADPKDSKPTQGGTKKK
jgi:hypothetical protein